MALPRLYTRHRQETGCTVHNRFSSSFAQLQTLAFDDSVVPSRTVQTQDGFRRAIVSVFKAGVTLNDH